MRKKEYYDTGELRYIWRYLGRKLDGLTKEFYKDGNLKREIHFKQGRIDGAPVIYDKSGKKM